MLKAFNYKNQSLFFASNEWQTYIARHKCLIMTDLVVKITIAILLFLFLLKLLSWINLEKRSRVGIIASFLMWYSKIGIHDSDTEREKTFKVWNNRINTLFWICCAILIAAFVFDTDYETAKDVINSGKKHR